MEKIHLLLADDHLDVLSSLVMRLNHEPHIEVVGEATNSAQAIAFCLTEKPAVILMDPMMRDGLGMNAVRQISTRCQDTQIVILTAVVDTALEIELRKLGVSHVLKKGLYSTELVGVIEDVVYTKVLNNKPLD
jgi:DNA-binding NarL/FixJ family response regulator